ncbi:MAG TPA: hypothetical protein VKT50_01075 [Candidatus Acidoferrales bacterium]|nr:hypothetical protein [Candidatus Acidoferrales bacterium]
MKRSSDVTAAAIVLFFGSAQMVLMTVFMIVGATNLLGEFFKFVQLPVNITATAFGAVTYACRGVGRASCIICWQSGN